MLEIQKFTLRVLKQLGIDPAADVFWVLFCCGSHNCFQISRIKEGVQVSRIAPYLETFEFHQSPGSDLWFPTRYKSSTVSFICCHYLPTVHIVVPLLVKHFVGLQRQLVSSMAGLELNGPSLSEEIEKKRSKHIKLEGGRLIVKISQDIAPKNRIKYTAACLNL